MDNSATSQKLRFGLSAFALLVVVALLRAQAEEPPFPPFGDSAKAEFYTVQPNPESSDGALVMVRGTAEAKYLVPSVLLGSTGIATVNVTPSNVVNLYVVSMFLNPTGTSTIQQFISANGSNALIELVWNNEIVASFTADQLDTNGGEIVVASDLLLNEAEALRAALLAP